MEIKKITEGMTAPQVAQVIDDNFKGLNEEKANKVETNAKLYELESKTLSIETRMPEYSLDNGYINTSGGIGSSSSANWKHSNPIHLSIGESIVVYCKATAAIAVVSISNEDGSLITPKLFGKDGDNYLYYSFVANQDSFVVVSFQTDSKSADYQILININQDNAVILESLSNLGSIMGGDLPSSITDLNDIPIGTSYLLTSKREDLANAPYYPFSGAIHTLSVNKDNLTGSIQMVSKEPGELWIRTRWASWSNWFRVASSESLSNLGGIMGGDLPSNIINLDDIPIGTSYLLTSKREASDLANAPYYPFSGGIHTLSVSKDNSAGSIQIVAKESGELWIRTRWASWSNWFRLSSIDNLKISQGGNILPMYNNIVFIGDSLTWCQVYTDTANKISRRAKVTYPEILCKLSGLDCDVNKFVAADGSKRDNESGIIPDGYTWNNECNVFASKGYSSSKWWEIYNSRLFERSNALYIVYLGTNGGLTDTIDEDCQGDDLESYTNTNTGCYGKILKKINDVGSKAILVKIYDSSSQEMTDTTNSVIDKFGTRYNMPVVENSELTEFCYRCTPDKTQTGGIHYNDLGYSKFASNLIDAISNMSASMLLRLI